MNALKSIGYIVKASGEIHVCRKPIAETHPAKSRKTETENYYDFVERIKRDLEAKVSK